MQRKKKKQEETKPMKIGVTQTESNRRAAFDLFGASPKRTADFELFKNLRYGVPVIDAAIGKLVRLLGTFKVEAKEPSAQKALEEFLKSVKVGAHGEGINTFVDAFFEQMLVYGTAVGEMIVSGTHLTHLYNAELKNVMLKSGRSDLETIICARNADGMFEPIKYPELILLGTHDAAPGELYGTSILQGLDFVSDILIKIYNTIGINWERVGNIRYCVTYKPQDENDKAYAKERAMQVASQWSKAMDANGPVRDFIAVGDVSIKAIGADNQILDSSVPVRQMLEQIVSKLGVPPFLLGLNWSTTERMSSQQADILTSEIDSYRREVTPTINKICRTFLLLEGFEPCFEVVWDDVTLQDITQIAQSEYYRAQSEKIRSEIKNTKKEEA